MEAKRKAKERENELRAKELKLMEERQEQDRLDRAIAREKDAKYIEFMSIAINKLK